MREGLLVCHLPSSGRLPDMGTREETISTFEGNPALPSGIPRTRLHRLDHSYSLFPRHRDTTEHRYIPPYYVMITFDAVLNKLVKR